MSKQHQLKELIVRFQQGKCSEQEIQQLQDLLREADYPGLLEEVYDILPEDFSEDKLSKHKATIYQQILQDDRVHPDTADEQTPVRRLWWRKSWVAVAAVALVVITPLLYHNLSFFDMDKSTMSEDSAQYAIVPGGDRARIILDDGTEINLEEIGGDTVIAQNGFSIVKEADGAIYYRYDDAQVLAQSAIYNTVVTPKGGQYQIVLPDGTGVWLNAESKLKYPVYFDKDKREVILEGEGYFEVAKQMVDGKQVPFLVFSGAQQLEVLGTAFNIQAYGEDVKTTLVEGKVRLGLENETNKVLLQANDEAVLDVETQDFDIRKVDPMYATAWKDGNFAFRRASIKEVMDDVARWYDIDVEYSAAAAESSNFTGTISRFEQFDKLLETIAFTGSVQFTIEGRRVIVEE